MGPHCGVTTAQVSAKPRLLDSKFEIVCFTGYFRGVDVTNRENLVVTLFEKGAV
jgi:hypothetical protein